MEINVNFTEEELVVISKLLGYVGGNYSAYSADNKIQEALGRDMEEDDYASVKFYQQHTCNFGKCFEMKQIEDNSDIEIRIE